MKLHFAAEFPNFPVYCYVMLHNERDIPMCHSHICSEIAIMILNGVCSYNFDDFWGGEVGHHCPKYMPCCYKQYIQSDNNAFHASIINNNPLLSSSYMVPSKDKTVPFSSNSNKQLQGWDRVLWYCHLSTIYRESDIASLTNDQWPWILCKYTPLSIIIKHIVSSNMADMYARIWDSHPWLKT